MNGDASDTGSLEARLIRLAEWLDTQAANLRAEAPSELGYGRGNDRGIAQGYELAAKFIRQEMATSEVTA